MGLNFFKKKRDEPIREKKITTTVKVMYSYNAISDDCKNPLCVKLMELNRLYTRKDIEDISAQLGYSVWHRRGGEGCTHEWKTETVTTQTEK